VTIILHNAELSRMVGVFFLGLATVLLAVAAWYVYRMPTAIQKVREALPWGMVAIVLAILVRSISGSEGVSRVSVDDATIVFDYPWSSVVVDRGEVQDVGIRNSKGRGTRRSGRTESLVVEVTARGVTHKMWVRTQDAERADQLRRMAATLQEAAPKRGDAQSHETRQRSATGTKRVFRLCLITLVDRPTGTTAQQESPGSCAMCFTLCSVIFRKQSGDELRPRS
jgi:hypothetical protein